jgi:hypothetical protein
MNEISFAGIDQSESMKSILSRYAGPSPSPRENASVPKEKAPVRRGRGLEIRMEYQKKQLLQVLGQMLLLPSASLCH